MRLPSRLPTEAAPIGDCLGKLPVARPPSQAALRPFLPSFLGRWVKNGCADATQNCFRWARRWPYDARVREGADAGDGRESPRMRNPRPGGSVLRAGKDRARCLADRRGTVQVARGATRTVRAAWLPPCLRRRSRTVRRLPLLKAGGGNAKQGGKNEQGILAS